MASPVENIYSTHVDDDADLFRRQSMRDMPTQRFDPWRVAQFVSVGGLIVLFPGFVFVHYSVAAFGVTLPAILDGLFGFSSALLVVIFAALFPLILRGYANVISPYILAVFGFITFTLIWAFTHTIVLDGAYVKVAFIQSVETAVLWSALFFVGMFLPEYSSTLYRTLAGSFLLILGFLLLYVVQTGELTFNASRMYNADHVASYQGFARSTLVILIILLTVASTIKQRTVLLLGGLFILFLLGARSEFYAFVATALLMVSMLMLKDGRYALLMIATIGGTSVTISLGYESLIQSRQLEILDLPSSSSWQSRQWLNEIAIRQVLDTPVFGYFGGHVVEGGGTGSYAHNMLSGWVNYGVLGFFWYLLLSLSPLLISIKRLVAIKTQDPVWMLAFTTNFCSLLLMTAAKPVFWPIAALGWGFCARAILLSSRRVHVTNT
ncbi:hypothetical protein [Thiohalomonas denitrificans]|uniref:O-antigen ligase like membrane protein n=1 Tax=Thiohalomonas denitrificans TaxID=415747 RepID=A0A1G5QI86_9GAMM|nr:hypothetical protein [Thiohalomonas denitrificans]SCZ61514.1 hypothetical protein SAMN03097708_02148 [Thiohalomonas denitrificans]